VGVCHSASSWLGDKRRKELFFVHIFWLHFGCVILCNFQPVLVQAASKYDAFVPAEPATVSKGSMHNKQIDDMEKLEENFTNANLKLTNNLLLAKCEGK
jgi:hypothetical protein